MPVRRACLLRSCRGRARRRVRKGAASASQARQAVRGKAARAPIDGVQRLVGEEADAKPEGAGREEFASQPSAGEVGRRQRPTHEK